MQKVTDPALLAQLNGGQTPAPTPRRGTVPEMVVAPRPKVVSPQEAERLGMERTRLGMSIEDQARQNQAATLSATKSQLEIDKALRDAAAGPVADAREGEANNAAYAARARKALDEYNTLEQALGGPRSFVGGMVAAIPGGETLLRAMPDAIGDNPDRRASERAKLDFVNLVLRSDSGAAVPEQEVERGLKTYFPQPGESDPSVIEAYRSAREAAVEGLTMKAGRLGPTLQGGSGPNTLPTAAGAKDDPGVATAGVQDAGKGGLSPIPEFRGMADDVKALLQRGSSADEIIQYVSKRHADAGRPPPNEERLAFIRDVVADRQRNPNAPAGALAQNWQLLEMQENPDVGGTALGSLADTGVGAGIIGAADVVTGGFLDELAGALGGNTDNARAVLEGSAAERPVSTFAGNIAGGAMLPVGRGAQTAKGMAKIGAGYGGVYGAGSAEGGLDDRAAGAVAGGLLGGVTGYGASRLLSPSGVKTQRQAERAGLLADFTDQGIDALPANVGGAPTRVATSGAGQAILSSGSIRNAVGRQSDQFGEAVTRAADSAGGAVPVDEAGQLARTAAERFSKKTSQRGSTLYDRAERAAGDVKIVPQQAIAEIDAKIARLTQSPDEGAATMARELEAFKGRLQEGVSIVGLRDARTRLSQGVYDGKLRSGADQKAYRDILGKVADDIETGLRAEGKEKVAGMFKTADKYWTERVQYIDEVLEPIVGKNRSGEQVMQSIESMAAGKGGGVQRLSKLMQSLSDKERGEIQGTVITRMGRATKGNQDDTGEAFSASTFLTNWNGMSSKGKAAMFGDGDLRQSLDQIARVASNMKDVSRYTNTSNTAGALTYQAMISGAAGLVSLPTAIMTGAGQYLTGKMLASPKFAAWLAKAPRNATPQQARAYTDRLRNVATAEPVIASDVGKFAQFLNAANDTSPNVAVAAPEGQQEND